MISDDTLKKTICKNITKYRKLAGLNQKEFASKLGAAPSRVSSWETGANSTDIDTLFRICEILNVSINDMLEVYPDANVMLSYLEQEHIKKYRFISTHSPDGAGVVDTVLDREYAIAEKLKEKDSRITELQVSPAAIIELHNGANEKSRLIEYFRSVSAGTGQVIYDDVYSERITMPDIPEYRCVAYAVKVDGRSMEPLYSDGDILLIEPTCEINIGEIGIFNVNGLAYVKQLGQDRLISLNKGYDDVPLTEDSVCMGRVVDKLD